MPPPGAVEALVSVARRHAFSVRHESSRADADRLLAAIEPILGTAAAAQSLNTVGRGQRLSP